MFVTSVIFYVEQERKSAETVDWWKKIFRSAPQVLPKNEPKEVFQPRVYMNTSGSESDEEVLSLLASAQGLSVEVFSVELQWCHQKPSEQIVALARLVMKVDGMTLTTLVRSLGVRGAQQGIDVAQVLLNEVPRLFQMQQAHRQAREQPQIQAQAAQDAELQARLTSEFERLRTDYRVLAMAGTEELADEIIGQAMSEAFEQGVSVDERLDVPYAAWSERYRSKAHESEADESEAHESGAHESEADESETEDPRFEVESGTTYNNKRVRCKIDGCGKRVARTAFKRHEKVHKPIPVEERTHVCGCGAALADAKSFKVHKGRCNMADKSPPPMHQRFRPISGKRFNKRQKGGKSQKGRS